MVKNDNSLLERAIGDFLDRYEVRFRNLAWALDKAHISHYSSGCGHKSITFQIFPASGHIRELARLLSLEREHKKASSGLRDASVKPPYNPAMDFLLYLRRWAGFCEQVMRGEGDSTRGVAAAQAKLIIDDLLANLMKSGEFAQLMDNIGQVLAVKTQKEDTHRKAAAKEAYARNYSKAMASAQGEAA